jgi:hypothetical protein
MAKKKPATTKEARAEIAKQPVTAKDFEAWVLYYFEENDWDIPCRDAVRKFPKLLPWIKAQETERQKKKLEVLAAKHVTAVKKVAGDGVDAKELTKALLADRNLLRTLLYADEE